MLDEKLKKMTDDKILSDIFLHIFILSSFGSFTGNAIGIIWFLFWRVVECYSKVTLLVVTLLLFIFASSLVAFMFEFYALFNTLGGTAMFALFTVHGFAFAITSERGGPWLGRLLLHED